MINWYIITYDIVMNKNMMNFWSLGWLEFISNHIVTAQQQPQPQQRNNHNCSWIIVTAQQQPQPQQQNNHNCSWVETN